MKFTLLPRPRRCSLLVCSLLALPLLAAGVRAEGIPGYVVLPLVPVRGSNQATLRVKVNNLSTMLVVDTGASTTAIDRNLYAAARVRSNDAAPGQLPPEVGRKFKANGEPAEVGYLDSLKAGEAELGKRSVGVLNLGGVFGQYNNLHGRLSLGGLMGEDVLQHYSAIIDWRRRGVYFNIDPSKRMKLGGGLVAGGWTAVPMAPTNYHHFTVQCEVGGKAARLVVDTGAGYTSFGKGIVPITMMYNRSHDSVSIGHLGTNSGTMSMIGQDATTYPGRAEHWKIGNFEIASSVVAVSDLPAWLREEQSAGEGPVLGFLGCEIMAKNSAIIDIGGRTLYLKHPAH